MEQEDHVTILIEELKRDSKERESKLLRSAQCCIFKIPEEVSKNNDKAYKPFAFSIGPFHCSNPLTKTTYAIKLRYLKDLLYRNKSSVPWIQLIDHFKVMLLERHYMILEHYDRKIDNLSRDEFIKLLIVDGCFIIEAFLKSYLRNHHMLTDEEKKVEDDPIFNFPRMRKNLNHDLVLLENQIPWVVLETILDMTTIQDTYKVNLVSLTLDFFAPIFFSTSIPEIPSHFDNDRHILSLLRSSLLWNITREKTYKQDKTDDELEPVMLSAKTLDETGVKIQANLESKSILNVEFKDGALTIPQLKVNDTTEVLFRNLVSLELYCTDYEPIISSYVELFDDLVQTNADMKLLSDKKVVHNTLRLEKATQIFNQTSYERMDVKDNYYFDLIRDLEQYNRNKKGYYIRRWRVYRRELMVTYFSHPWAVISTIAASFVIICTFLQTLYTIMSYE